MELVAFDKLPPSHDALGEDIPVEPHHELLPWTFSGRGRAALPALAYVAGRAAVRGTAYAVAAAAALACSPLALLLATLCAPPLIATRSATYPMK